MPDKKFVVYGAGEIVGYWLASDRRIIPAYILETTPRPNRANYLGIPIATPEEVLNPDQFEVLISVTTTSNQTFRNPKNLLFGDDLAKYLYRLGFSKVHNFQEACMLFPNFIESIPPGEYLWLSDPDGTMVGELDNINLDKIELLRENLLDKQSEEVLNSLLRFRKNLDFAHYVFPEQDTDQYIDPLFLSKLPNKINILDLGGYDGDSAENFILEIGNKINRIFIAEPSFDNLNNLEIFRQLNKEFQQKTIPVLCAVGGSGGLAQIQGVGLTTKVERFSSSSKTLGNSSFVPFCSIDESFNNFYINLVKMDIEGGELEAIIGAKNYIEKSPPYFAVAGYHKPRDLYEIPEKILSFNSNYKFILRVYGHMVKELVIYGVPTESG